MGFRLTVIVDAYQQQAVGILFYLGGILLALNLVDGSIGILAAIDLPKRRQRVTQVKPRSVNSVLLTTEMSPDLSMYSLLRTL